MIAHRRLIAIVIMVLALVPPIAFANLSQPQSFGRGRPVTPRPKSGAVTGRLIVGLRNDSAFSARSLAKGAASLAQRWGAGLRTKGS